MGQENSKNDTKEPEDIIDFLDENPQFLATYIDRNPNLLDNYVHENVDEYTVQKWLEKVAGPPPSAVLQVRKVNYLKGKNELLHYTNKYDHPSLIVRRADKFFLDLSFKNREFRIAKDTINLEFSIGPKPNSSSGTKIRVPIGESLQGSKWTAMLVKEYDQEKKISVEVNIPPTAIIGKYHLVVEVVTALEDGPQVERKNFQDIVVLFNPFQPADDVYMENAEERKEYVLNERGIIYQGSSRRIHGKNWEFGQFQKGVLDTALKLMRNDSRAMDAPIKSLKKRNSPVYCSRALSAMINCNNDDNGVLYGRWDGEYKDGLSPGKWDGSVKILQQWNDGGMEAVKYGQCWVFSGLLTTVLRAIGIPARSTTNFASAHDTEFNMTIDDFVDEDGKPVNKGDDSVWNFHVWNDCYFKRPDLPKGYDGWQAVDATPQEISGKLFQCGPAPLKAIKNGEIFIGYDTNFVFSEVNADRCIWKLNKEGEVIDLVKKLQRSIGKDISTKAVGSFERHDITDEYKHREGTPEERDAFELAYAHGKRADYHDEFLFVKDEGKVLIEIAEVGDTIWGDPMKIKVSVTNTTEIPTTFAINTAVFSILHTGARKHIIRTVKEIVYIEAKQTEVKMIEIEGVDYCTKLVDGKVVRTTTSVKNMNDNNMYVDSNDITVDMPTGLLSIKCVKESDIRTPFDVQFELKNNFKQSLTGGEFTITGYRLTEKSIKINDVIEPGKTYLSEPVSTKCYGKGPCLMTATFDCNELQDLKGEQEVNIL